MVDLGNFLAALSRDTLADVIGDLRQAVKDSNLDLSPALAQAQAMLIDKNDVGGC
jgi:hypothetical protein